MNKQLKILYDWIETEPKQLTRQVIREKILEIDKVTKTRSFFTPPTIQEISDYSSLNNLAIKAEQFYDHFESNGWLVGGKAKMKDWKAAVRNWARNPINKVKQSNYATREREPLYGRQTANTVQSNATGWDSL